MTNFQEFYKIILYDFRDENLLKMALTHPSLNTKNSQNFNYERLEFLGDSILRQIISDYLFIRYQEMQEGDLTKLRSQIENGSSLAEMTRKIGLNKYVLIM